MKKKILLTNHHLENFAGSEINCLTLATELGKKYEVDVFAYLYGEPIRTCFENAGIKVYNIYDETLKNKEYDLIWAHHKPTLDDCLFLRKIRAKKIIFSSLSPYEPLEAPPYYANALTKCLANSYETRDELIKDGVDKNNIIVFPNYAPSAYFESNFVVPNYVSKICIVSNHVPEELLAFSKACNNDIKVDIYGIGNTECLITPSVLEKYDCVITIGKTVQYAMAMGIPVYCYDHFGGPGWLTEGVLDIAAYYNFSGRGFKRETTEELLKDIIDGYEDNKCRLERLKQYAKNNFCLDTNLSLLIDDVINEEILDNNTLLLNYGISKRESLLYKRSLLKALEIAAEHNRLWVKTNTLIEENNELREKGNKLEEENNWLIKRSNALETELNRINKSDGMKILKKYYRLRDKLLPISSKRRFVFLVIFKQLKRLK